MRIEVNSGIGVFNTHLFLVQLVSSFCGWYTNEQERKNEKNGYKSLSATGSTSTTFFLLLFIFTTRVMMMMMDEGQAYAHTLHSD